MKSILKFSSVLLTTILLLVVSSSASSIGSGSSISTISEPFSLMLIGVALIGVGSFLRRMKAEIA